MTPTAWEHLRTDETRMVEDKLREFGAAQVDAYRYNSASIRIRIIDPRFAGLKWQTKIAMVDTWVETLPEATQECIITASYFFSPGDLAADARSREANEDFENPNYSFVI